MDDIITNSKDYSEHYRENAKSLVKLVDKSFDQKIEEHIEEQDFYEEEISVLTKNLAEKIEENEAKISDLMESVDKLKTLDESYVSNVQEIIQYGVNEDSNRKIMILSQKYDDRLYNVKDLEEIKSNNGFYKNYYSILVQNKTL